MMRYIVLGLFLALAACNQPPPEPDPMIAGMRVVEPKETVLIGNCEYYVFHNNHGVTYAPKMTPQDTLSGQKTGGFNRCYAP